MNLKTTYLLFGVLLAVLIVLAAITFWGGEPGPTGETAEYLFPEFNRVKDPVKTDDIDSIRIDRTSDGKKETIFFTRSKDTWELKEPYSLRTDSSEVNTLVREVTGIQREKSQMSQNLAEYGLDNPSTVVTFKKGDQEWKLNVGKQGEGAGGVVYVSNAAKPKEPTPVKKTSLADVFKKVNDFREKSLLTARDPNVPAVELDAKGTVLALEKTSEGSWRFKKPAYGPANFEGDSSGLPPVGEKKINGVRDLLTDVGELRVETDGDFIAESVSDADLAEKYGLAKDKPETLRIEAKVLGKDAETKTEVLLIGKKAPKPDEKKDDAKKDAKKPEEGGEYYYARLESENAVVRVPGAKVKPLLDLAANADALRSRDLVTVSISAKIDALDIQARGNLVKLRQVDNKWTLYHDGARATDSQAVRELIDAISSKKPVKTFPDKEDGLDFDKPTAVVSVWIDGIKKDEKKDAEKKDEDKKDEKKDDKEKEPSLKSDKPTVKLTFGKRDTDKNIVFVKRESGDDKTIVTVSDTILDKVAQGPLAYYDRTLPTFAESHSFPPVPPAKDVTKLTLQRGGETWEVAQETADNKSVWKIVQPQALMGRTANEFSITSVIQDLANLRAEKFVGEKPSEGELEQLYGLKTPATKVTVTVKKGDKTEDWVYSFGKQTDTKNGVYARQSKNDLVFLVPKLTVDHINEAEFRNLTVFSFDMAKVKGAKITGWAAVVGSPLTLDLTREKEREWKANAPKDFAVDGGVAESFISGLSNLRASRFVTPKGDPGLDVVKGALKIEITVEGEKEPLELTIDAEDPDNKEFYFASSNKLKGDTFLVPKLSFEKTKEKPAYFKKP